MVLMYRIILMLFLSTPLKANIFPTLQVGSEAEREAESGLPHLMAQFYSLVTLLEPCCCYANGCCMGAGVAATKPCVTINTVPTRCQWSSDGRFAETWFLQRQKECVAARFQTSVRSQTHPSRDMKC